MPEVPGVPVIGEDRPPATPWDDLLKDLTKTLATTKDSIESSLRREEETYERTTALLASREVRAAGRQNAKLQAQIEEIAAAAKTRLEESKTRAEEQIRVSRR